MNVLFKVSRPHSIDPLIDTIRANTFQELQRLFEHHDAGDLPTVVESVEEILKSALKIQLLELVHLYASKVSRSSRSNLLITPHGTIELEIAETALHKRTLDIAFVAYPLNRAKTSYVERSLTLDGFGRFTTFRINWPRSIPCAWTPLIEIITAIITATYRWLENYVSVKLSEVESDLSLSLYSYARAAFQCDPNLLQRFWFVAIRGGKGYCLFDQRLVFEALSIASAASIPYGVIPSEAAANFVVNEADFELMIAKEAIKQGVCIDVSFSKSPYRDLDVKFSRSEAAMHGTDKISLFPILRDGDDGFLVAGFPAPKRRIFEPLLRKHEGELVKIFRDHLHTLRKLEALMGKLRHQTNLGKIGQLLGGFTRGFIDS